MGIILARERSDFLELLLEGISYERRKIEVEGRDGLTSVHLVLNRLH